ncbi:MAG: acyl-CoA dehydrogenase family protein [Gemmatimonadota bacterium]|nr:acyl-CoA dehydrogenase family protein [Gemmatimonadota bacterium]
MDFSLTQEQEQLRSEVVGFARKELNHGVAERDRDQEFPRDLWLKCGQMGLQGLPVPEEYGGLGLDPLSCAVALDAFGLGCEDSGLVFSVCAHLLACVVPVWKFGTEEQKRRYLPGLCDGTIIAVNSMSEPDSGSDAFALRTRAERVAGGFRLTGTKTFATNGPVANLSLAFATTDPEKGAYGGVTAFLVDMDTPGVQATRKIPKMGLRTSPFGEVVFDEAFVPDEAVLGGIGGGADLFGHSMDWERICLFASHVGTLERLVDKAVKYARTRRQFGQNIGKFQAVSHKIADMKIRLETARLLTYRGASRLERSRFVSMDAAMVKVYVSEALVESARDVMQIFGGYGYCTEYEIERAVRDALGSTLYSGTSEMQRNIIGGWLGL